MDISIFSHNIKIPLDLQNQFKEKVNKIAHKYFPHPIWAKIHFNKEATEIHCDININEGTGHHYMIKSDSIDNDLTKAFDNSLSRLEKQLRKYKGKLSKKHGRISNQDLIKTKKFIINRAKEEEYQEDIVEKKNNNPVIIAEHMAHIANISVDQAVMIMDLENVPAFMFKNSQTGKINMIYKMKCGNITWIESPE